MNILENINSHEDLVRLNDQQREELCREIRSFLVSNIAKTGGHLASNLGVVELSVALETVFDTSIDRLVFDVGHQSYVHKMLTGRQADFAHLRQFGGMAGFPKPKESQQDRLLCCWTCFQFRFYRIGYGQSQNLAEARLSCRCTSG